MLSVMERRFVDTVGKAVLGLFGSGIVSMLMWKVFLEPMGWPGLRLVLNYLFEQALVFDTYLAMFMTGFRAVTAMLIGYASALVLSFLTGRSFWGWACFFFLLLFMQKVPAIAMIHVFVSSKLGIGFLMTVSLASVVVMTFTWLILHHRAETLDPKEIFALRIAGFRGWRLQLYGLLPHYGSSIGASARLGMSISLIMIVMGEWQGVWSDGSIWQYGLGVQISRHYQSIHSEARVLASCFFLGLLGIAMDLMVRWVLIGIRRITGVSFSR